MCFWISPGYGPFSVGGILKLVKRLFIFQFFFGPRQTADTESVGTGARLCLCFFAFI
jgi:hypothetical protein